jgi:uncharacterized protein (DUF2267 family)
LAANGRGSKAAVLIAGTAIGVRSFALGVQLPPEVCAMSATGLEVFDKTLQTTNIWLNEIMEAIGPDRHVAWKVLSTVLHKLRDRLDPGLAAHLGAQLPLLIRGAYYDQYEPGRQPSDCDTREEFSAEVAEWLADTRPVDPDEAIRAVCAVLTRHVSVGQMNKVRQGLPRQIRAWFDMANGTSGTPPGADLDELAEAAGDASV